MYCWYSAYPCQNPKGSYSCTTGTVPILTKIERQLLMYWHIAYPGKNPQDTFLVLMNYSTVPIQA
jgi:hypothetical protein